MKATNPDRNRMYSDYIATWNIKDLWDPWLVPSTLPSDTEEDKLIILSLIQADATPVEELVGNTFPMWHYIVHPVTITQVTTGRQWKERRIVFPQENKLPIDSMSLAIIKGIGKFVEESNRWPPWYPPLEVMVHRQSMKTAPKYTLKYIR